MQLFLPVIMRECGKFCRRTLTNWMNPSFFGWYMGTLIIRISLILILLGCCPQGILAQTLKPEVTSIAPDNGIPGDRIRLFGSHFENILGITFNGTLARDFTVTAQNQILVTIPLGATSGPISIQNNIGIHLTESDFRVYLPGPRPESFSPAAALVGETITITGRLFTNSTRIIFGGDVPATQFLVRTTSEIDVIVPQGAKSGPIRLVDGNVGNTSETSFTVVKINDLSFTFQTPDTTVFPTNQEAKVEWVVTPSGGQSGEAVELTLLIPPAGVNIHRIESTSGTSIQRGRFVQISNVTIPEAGTWKAGLVFTPTVANEALTFEGSVASIDRDANLSNNSMVRQFAVRTVAGQLEFLRVDPETFQLIWPAIPDSISLYSSQSIDGSSPWIKVNRIPVVDNSKKTLTIRSQDILPNSAFFRIATE